MVQFSVSSTASIAQYSSVCYISCACDQAHGKGMLLLRISHMALHASLDKLLTFGMVADRAGQGQGIVGLL